MILSIRNMNADDLPLGMRLKRQAGWNQTQGDWRRFLSLEPTGCFVATVDGRPVGTTTTCIFPAATDTRTAGDTAGASGRRGKVAWVAMVLVDQAARGRGVGSALLRHAIDHLDARGVRSIRLDATPAGRPLYEKLGFVFQFELVRYGGIVTPPEGLAKRTAGDAAPVVRVQQATQSDWDAIIQLDAQVVGVDRGKLLRALFEAHPDALRTARDGDKLLGYITDRPGDNAHMLGPSVALTTAAGDALLLDAFARHAGKKVYIDLPVATDPATELAELIGLTIERPLYRMTRGQPVCEQVQHLWASSGPEMG